MRRNVSHKENGTGTIINCMCGEPLALSTPVGFRVSIGADGKEKQIVCNSCHVLIKYRVVKHE